MEIKSKKDIDALIKEVESLDGSYPLIIEIKQVKTTRTLLQKNFMFANYQHLSQVLYDSGMTKNVFGVEKAYSQYELHDFTKSTLGKETTRFSSIKEFSEFMERAFAFWINFTMGEFQPLESVRGYFERNGYDIDEEGNIKT